MRLIVFLILLPFACPAFAAQTAIELPDFGDSAGAVISPLQERTLGEEFMREVRHTAPLITDPEVEDYLRDLGMRLVTTAQYDGAPTFFLIDNPEINAFAIPGGFVGVHTGLILNSTSEGELASVLAHELIHLTQRHTVRSIEARGRSAIPSLIAMLGAIALAAANPEAGQAALAGVAAVQEQLAINYTRSHEQEADRLGIQLLADSGFDPFAMPSFFQRLQVANRYNDPEQIPEYLRTHPVTINRIAESRDRAERLPRVADESSYGYYLIRAKLMVLTAKNPIDAKQLFERAVRGGDDDMDERVARFGYALALTYAGEHGRAREQIAELIGLEPEQIAYLLAAGEIESAAGNYDAASAWFRRALDLDRTSNAALYGYGRALALAGKPVAARQALREHGYGRDPDPQYFKVLAEVEGRAGNVAEARIAQAEYYFQQGEYQFAVRELEMAERHPGLTNYQTQRIRARMVEIQKQLSRRERDSG